MLLVRVGVIECGNRNAEGGMCKIDDRGFRMGNSECGMRMAKGKKIKGKSSAQQHQEKNQEKTTSLGEAAML